MSHLVPNETRASPAARREGSPIPGLVVAIPCFNEEVAIGSVVLRARRWAQEVVVIDDGSSDASAEVATLAGARVIRHGANQGYGGALRTAFRTAREEQWPMLVILDSDGQHNPDEIPAVVRPVLEGHADVSIGSRFVEGASMDDAPAYRRLGIRVLTGLNNIGAGDSRVTDGQSGFRAYSRRALMAIEPRESDMGISAEILFQARKTGLLLAEVPIRVRYDVEGSSQNPVRHGLGVIGSILRYAEREHPLIFFGVPGFAALIAGVLMAVYALSVYFQSHYLPFGPTVASAFLGLAGLMSGITGLILHAVIVATSK